MSRPSAPNNDYAKWCHLILCGVEVEFEDCRKCNPKKPYDPYEDEYTDFGRDGWDDGFFD